MAAPRSPTVQVGLPTALPTLIDPNNVKEVFSNQLVGISVTDQNVHLTLSIVRPRHNNPGGPTDNENVVSERAVITVAAMNAIVEAYSQLLFAMQTQQAMKPN